VPYRGVVAASGAGLLTANDDKAWFEALQLFVSDRDRIIRAGQMARSWVQKHKTLRTGLDEFDALLRAVVKGGRTAEDTPRRGYALSLDEAHAG
jgi:hypothetical protein